MIKKTIGLIACLLILAGLTACGTPADDAESTDSRAATATTTTVTGATSDASLDPLPTTGDAHTTTTGAITATQPTTTANEQGSGQNNKPTKQPTTTKPPMPTLPEEWNGLELPEQPL